MAIVIQMPKLGHTMTEGKVLKWHKHQGEPVREGEAVLTIESDKTEVEIESPGAGVMGEQSAAEGEVVPVGGRLAVIEQASPMAAGATPPAAAPPEDGGHAVAARESAVAPLAAAASRALASPRAKKLATQSGVDLAAITGSGKNGLVTEEDVRRAVASRAALVPNRGAGTGAAPELGGALSPARREKLTRIQAIGARNLSASWNAIPHFVQMTRVDMSRTLEARKALQGSARHSITDFVLAATVRALQDNPRINASYAEGEMLIYDQINLGVAVDTPDGLIVPVVHRADTLDLDQLSARVAELAAKARAKRLTPAELEGATFTVSNLGAFGVENGTPVIFAPQSALMFVGAVRDQVLAVEGRAQVRPAMQISIAYDHRGIDGATAARFTTRVKAILEEGRFGAPVGTSRKRPARAREVSIEAIGNAMHTRASYGDHSWELQGDAPGNPSPVEGFLAALGSCLLMSLQAAAQARKLEVGRTSLVARSNETGHVESIEIELRLETPESDDKLHKLIEIAERGCHVRRLLSDRVPVKLTVERI